ncbi:PPK2 family polyphosphate kinase [Candidatus Microthrix sp.]|uniref:PPK2 family polyphosphate kinase n=1 Tax=Candidatus Neomicrothrix sp. TaxID=2719034 RepID=UPI001B3DA993|nr:PPK2 family polyphosphate kinase [Candidatus Microthrix sp.]MBP9064769.1 polyphosphate kinase 2 family protein [Candidatus Microthrix sp.]
MDIAPYRYDPSQPVELSQWDGDDDGGLSKDDTKDATAELSERLVELQHRLFAQKEHRVLVVIQATDTGGKDSTIRRVFGPLNPAGVRVTGFTKPSEDELAHDYLWRVHPHAPGDGMIAVFNRSHYEDVLVVRVHDLVPEARWRRRYQHLREFERMLTDEGTTVIKFFLHITADEQRQRLQDRIDDTTKWWKFNPADLTERERWDDYQAAFSEMLSQTSDPVPWWVIPANHKWFRDYLVSKVLVDTLEGLNLTYPEPEEDLTGVTIT